MSSVVLWSIALVIAALGLVASVQSWRFGRLVAHDTERLFALRGAGSPIHHLEALPPPVRRYAELVGATTHRARAAPAARRHLPHSARPTSTADSRRAVFLLRPAGLRLASLLDQRYVTWSPIEDRSARATLRLRGREVSASFFFGDDGLLARMTAERPRSKGTRAPWVGEYSDYREVEGLRVPFVASVSWVLDGVRNEYAHWVMESFEFDRAEPF